MLCGWRHPDRNAICVLEVRPVNRHDGVAHALVDTLYAQQMLETVVTEGTVVDWIFPPPFTPFNA